jgi:hypothetical protein
LNTAYKPSILGFVLSITTIGTGARHKSEDLEVFLFWRCYLSV